MAGTDEDLEKGSAALFHGDFDAARHHFEKALKADPANAEAHFGWAESALGLPEVKPEDILAHYAKACETDPKNPQYREAIASFCLDIGRFNDAEKAYNEAAAMDPDNAAAYYADFAVNYYRKAPVIMEKYLDDNTRRLIAKKAMEYALKALGMTSDEALGALKG